MATCKCKGSCARTPEASSTSRETVSGFLVDSAFKWWEAVGPVLRVRPPPGPVRAVDTGRGQAKRSPTVPSPRGTWRWPPPGRCLRRFEPLLCNPLYFYFYIAQDSGCPRAGTGAGAATPAPAR